MTPLRSPERPPSPHTTSQIQNGLNYHFNLGPISACDIQYPYYENLIHGIQISQQTLTLEGHQPYHYMYYKIRGGLVVLHLSVAVVVWVNGIIIWTDR